MPIVVTDTLSLLAFIASPALVAWLSTQAEHWVWFQSINKDGKQGIIIGISIALALLAMFARSALQSNLGVLAEIDPYVVGILPIVNYFVSQIVHGTANAKTRQVTTAAAAKAINPT